MGGMLRKQFLLLAVGMVLAGVMTATGSAAGGTAKGGLLNDTGIKLI